MSYYSEVSKVQRIKNLRIAAMAGAPEGACFIPDTAIAYCFNHPTETHCTVYLHRWTPSGRHIMVGIPVVSNKFVYKGDTYILHWESLTVFKEDHVFALPVDKWEDHRRRELRWLDCQSVDMSKVAAHKDVTETSRQAYHRRQAQALIAAMPAGYTPLPGIRAAAYKVEGSAVSVIKMSAPQTLAKGGPRFKETTHPLYGVAIIGGKRYCVAPDGVRLYREGHSEDVFGAGDDTNEERIVFEELRPRTLPIVPGELAWYEIVPGATPKVRFGFVKGKRAVNQLCDIVASRVLFKDNSYTVDPFGGLTLVA